MFVYLHLNVPFCNCAVIIGASCWRLLCVSAVYPSVEPGWLQATYKGKTGLIPENYITYMWPTRWCCHAITVQPGATCWDVNGTAVLITFIYCATVTLSELLCLQSGWSMYCTSMRSVFKANSRSGHSLFPLINSFNSLLTSLMKCFCTKKKNLILLFLYKCP